jgi:hypothetical protein
MTVALVTACLLAGCTSGSSQSGALTTSSPATPAQTSAVSPLEGRWATGPTPIDDIRQALVNAGITPQDAARWVADVGAPPTYSFVLEFTGSTFTHSEETPDMPMQVGESGTFTLTGDRLLLHVPQAARTPTPSR